MPWVTWYNRNSAGDEPPQEWTRLSTELLESLPKKYVCKIESVAFVIKTFRTARWLLEHDNPEYCTRAGAVAVAKKLAWLALLSREPPHIERNLRQLLTCNDTVGCKLLIGHTGNCRTTGPQFNESSRCQMCGRRINIEDFDRNARIDPEGLTVGHRSPLSRIHRGHNARNIAWAHRACNQLQSEQTIDEALQRMSDILEQNGYTVTPP